MIARITAQNVGATDDPFRFGTEASDLGLPVGSIPKTLDTDLGNCLPFLFNRLDRETGTMIYKQALGCVTLYIFND